MNLKLWRRRLRWPFSFALLMVCLWLVQHLPLAWGRALARTCARVACRIPSLRRLMQVNLRLAFPELPPARREQIARNSLGAMAVGFVEFAWTLGDPARLKGLVSLADDVLPTCERLRASHGSIIFLTPHFGSWELGFQGLLAAGVPVSAVARRLPNPFMERWLSRARSGLGAGVIHEKGAAQGVFRTLRRGGNVGMLVDQNTRPRNGGLFVDFFGLPVTISRAPALFAHRSGAALLFGYARHDAAGRVVLQVRELPHPPAEYQGDEALSQAIAKLTEDLVREFPDEYLWLYERWLYIPPDWAGDRTRYPGYAKVSGTDD